MRKTMTGLALLCALAPAAALAGGPNEYGVSADPMIRDYKQASPTPPAYVQSGSTQTMQYNPAPVVAAPMMASNADIMRDGLRDEQRYGGNAELGYQPSAACGGLLEGARCLVILGDHMRRVRLDRPASTILVGNPAVADVTVLGKDTMFVSARSVGSTNVIVLDSDNNEIATYEVFVREPETKRVTLRQGMTRENFLCAPNCERALSQNDSAEAHQTKLGVITAELGLDQQAISLQQGSNPNTDVESTPEFQSALQQQLGASGGAKPSGESSAAEAMLKQLLSAGGSGGAAAGGGFDALRNVGAAMGGGGARPQAQTQQQSDMMPNDMN